MIPGFLLHWKSSRNEKGEAVSEVEPVRDPEIREDLKKIVLDGEKVQQVNFW